MSMFRFSMIGAAVIAAAVTSGPLRAAPSLSVSHDIKHDVSRPLRDILAELPPSVDQGSVANPYVVPNIFPKHTNGWEGEFIRELSLRGIQNTPSTLPAPSSLLSFLGLISGSSTLPGNAGTSIPPDTNGDISPTHYIQWLNTRWAIFDRTNGTRLTASAPGNSFFSGFGGKCEISNSGDPIALWDDRAGRWFMSQFTVPPTGSVPGPPSQCIAISTTSDPLGPYYRYEFQWPDPAFGDYPHFGIWQDESGTQDAYTLVTHEFAISGGFMGAAFIAFERDKMLAGLPAAVVRYAGLNQYGALPVHLDGNIRAPKNACPEFIHFDSGAGDYLFWDLCLDWATPASSILSVPQRVASDNTFVPNFDTVPQLGTTTELDSFGSNTMYLASARAYPPGAPNPMMLVINHATTADQGQAGLRWVQFRLNKPNFSFDNIFDNPFETVSNAPYGLQKSLLDEGLYAPDANYRWMGAVNIDSGGNIGAGYSVSGPTINPKLRITGRLATDAPGLLRNEQDCTPPSTGSQTGLFGNPPRSRWGDYASMSVDPVDQCTFWFTSEYHATTSNGSWSTRICSFKFPECGEPAFVMSTETPKRVEMCGTTPGPDPSWRLMIGSYGGFAGTINLFTVSPPAGTTPNFSTNPISPAPGISTLTLGGGHGLPSGEFAFSVLGSNGISASSASLEFGISDAAPNAPALTSPANAALDVSVRPTFTWTAVPGALTYLIQVATDAGFANIVASATVTETSWASNVTLNSITPYFWRVIPANYCGDGAFAARQFTTGTPGTCPIGTTTSTVFQDDVEGGTNGWTTDGTGDAGTSVWARIPATAGTGLSTTVWGIPNNPATSDRGLISPVINIPANAVAVNMIYDVYHSFEVAGPNSCYDAAFLEIKRNGGAFANLEETRMITDPYDGTIIAGSIGEGNRAWCLPPSAIPATAVIQLDDTAGQSVQFRYHHTSDANTVAASPNGMEIDNIRVDACIPVGP
jgi:hypothetical protein